MIYILIGEKYGIAFDWCVLIFFVLETEFYQCYSDKKNKCRSDFSGLTLIILE
jgi:hypothetical protein